ncbi:putative glycosyltransferase EpsJ [Phaeobacter sp. CECT 5382]|uniref:glycosyltransferase family 2 protein n=1 Tax=Phaeobacter sp. CECT 5382 TaxID=1712645 RepID=UPI0006DA193B|nr:glycosyltransferase [Phaeobacter sp. CECT 5382]CUH89373.1 putative glycosyltransferase EpsJ [Phaeobacter sp. CECT 5382]
MKFSFIVTSWNIEDYIGACLDSLAPCLAPGDELIVIDDGSDDGSCEEITAALARLKERGAALRPIFLGVNSPGGVGIPANVGLREATGEAIFFVDGDDWVDAAGLQAARRRFEAQNCDVLIANYRVYDAVQDQFSPPSDQSLWRGVEGCRSLQERRHLALQMVGVPWRKIYRRSFLEAHKIRFPEGDFFYEDNPFHWQVCLAATEIGFFNRSVCSHRMGRAGQTMAATGADLAVFFDHYERIVAQLPDPQYRPDVLRWLLENMAWHMERLAPAAQWIYAVRAEETLKTIVDADWQAMRHDVVAQRAWGAARALAQGRLGEVISTWQQQQMLRLFQNLEDRVAQIEQTATQLVDWSEGQRAVQEFHALKAFASKAEDKPSKG